MNCKPGDIAIIVKSRAGNEGKIVTCLRFIGPAPVGMNTNFNDWWEVDRCLLADNKTINPYIPDAFLRPLPKLREEIKAEQPANVQT